MNSGDGESNDASDQDTDRFIRAIYEQSTQSDSGNSSGSGGGGQSEYAILNETLYNLVVQQLSDKDSVLLKAIRLIHQQKTNANRTGPYGYLPAISGTPYDHFGQKASPYGELALILLVIVLWITSIMLCMNKYKKLRSLEPMIPAYNSGPSHIEDIKIVQNADEAVIYKKVRSSYLNLNAQPKINYILATDATPDAYIHHHSSPNNLNSSFFRSTTQTTPLTIRRSSSLPYCHRLTEMNKLYKSIQTNYSSPRPTPPPLHVIATNTRPVRDVYTKNHVRTVYKESRNWTVTNASHEIHHQTKRKVPTSLNFSNYRRNFVSSLGGGSNTFNTSQNNSSSSSNNFQMIKNISSNYKRVLDRRHLYARSKYFVKRVNVERDEPAQTPTNRSVSFKRSQDSTRSSSKDKEQLELVNMAAAAAAAAATYNSSQGSGANTNNTFDRGSGSFDTKLISEMDFSRKSSGLAMLPAKSPDLLDPNWIPQRVKSNLISLHKHIRRHRTDSAGDTSSSRDNATPPLPVTNNPTMSKSDTNLKFFGRRKEKRDKKQQLSLQEYQERKSNV